ncbi:mediator of RNA polymerase II transcription subunit 13 [Tieghemiomyces parasiticus]|uniref:Mediator of RNA polymerase II transcription subunit 13 n=1 Tax=Tieghemiomyces parasiticus TaxID=78921 RepID=A0A9W8A742_9FUNG|nr:mediator of RNA polymerase II transcription subunit 13 [Tieghemiomyces parasiticus]
MLSENSQTNVLALAGFGQVRWRCYSYTCKRSDLGELSRFDPESSVDSATPTVRPPVIPRTLSRDPLFRAYTQLLQAEILVHWQYRDDSPLTSGRPLPAETGTDSDVRRELYVFILRDEHVRLVDAALVDLIEVQSGVLNWDTIPAAVMSPPATRASATGLECRSFYYAVRGLLDRYLVRDHIYRIGDLWLVSPKSELYSATRKFVSNRTGPPASGLVGFSLLIHPANFQLLLSPRFYRTNFRPVTTRDMEANANVILSPLGEAAWIVGRPRLPVGAVRQLTAEWQAVYGVEVTTVGPVPPVLEVQLTTSPRRLYYPTCLAFTSATATVPGPLPNGVVSSSPIPPVSDDLKTLATTAPSLSTGDPLPTPEPDWSPPDPLAQIFGHLDGVASVISPPILPVGGEEPDGPPSAWQLENDINTHEGHPALTPISTPGTRAPFTPPPPHGRLPGLIKTEGETGGRMELDHLPTAPSTVETLRDLPSGTELPPVDQLARTDLNRRSATPAPKPDPADTLLHMPDLSELQIPGEYGFEDLDNTMDVTEDDFSFFDAGPVKPALPRRVSHVPGHLPTASSSRAGSVPVGTSPAPALAPAARAVSGSVREDSVPPPGSRVGPLSGTDHTDDEAAGETAAAIGVPVVLHLPFGPAAFAPLDSPPPSPPARYARPLRRRKPSVTYLPTHPIHHCRRRPPSARSLTTPSHLVTRVVHLVNRRPRFTPFRSVGRPPTAPPVAPGYLPRSVLHLLTRRSPSPDATPRPSERRELLSFLPPGNPARRFFLDTSSTSASDTDSASESDTGDSLDPDLYPDLHSKLDALFDSQPASEVDPPEDPTKPPSSRCASVPTPVHPKKRRRMSHLDGASGRPTTTPAPAAPGTVDHGLVAVLLTDHASPTLASSRTTQSALDRYRDSLSPDSFAEVMRIICQQVALGAYTASPAPMRAMLPSSSVPVPATCTPIETKDLAAVAALVQLLQRGGAAVAGLALPAGVLFRGPLTLAQLSEVAEQGPSTSSYGKAYIKRKRAPEPALETLPPAEIVVGYRCPVEAGDETLHVQVSPAILPVWEKMRLGPYAAAKHVHYFALVPSRTPQPADEYLVRATTWYLREVGTAYAACRLGTHVPGTAEGLASWLIPVADAGDTAQQLRQYLFACERLGAILRARAEAESTATHFVVYLVNPLRSRAAVVELANCIRMLTALWRGTRRVANRPDVTLVTQILEPGVITRAHSLGNRADLRAQAFSAYTQCYQPLTLPPEPPAAAAAPLHSLRLPPLHLNHEALRTLWTRTFAPPLVLARPRPSQLTFTFTTRTLPFVSPVDTDTTVYVFYSLALGGRWAVAVWADYRGQFLDLAVFENPPAEVEAYPGAVAESVLRQVWVKARALEDLYGLPFKFVVARLGTVPEAEWQAWDRLLNEHTNAVLVCVYPDSSFFAAPDPAKATPETVPNPAPTTPSRPIRREGSRNTAYPTPPAFSSPIDRSRQLGSSGGGDPDVGDAAEPDRLEPLGESSQAFVFNHRQALPLTTHSAAGPRLFSHATGYLLRDLVEEVETRRADHAGVLDDAAGIGTAAVDDEPAAGPIRQLCTEVRLMRRSAAQSATSLMRDTLRQFHHLSTLSRWPFVAGEPGGAETAKRGETPFPRMSDLNGGLVSPRFWRYLPLPVVMLHRIMHTFNELEEPETA